MSKDFDTLPDGVEIMRAAMICGAFGLATWAAIGYLVFRMMRAL